MVKVRKIDEKRLDKMIREVIARGEGVRSFQNAKQSVINSFKKERQRYRMGRISQKALLVSSKRVTNELALLDVKIRNDIKRGVNSARSAERYIHIYLPEKVRASVSGISKNIKKKKATKARKTKTAKRRAVKRKVARRRPAKRRVVKRKATKRRTVRRAAKRRPARTKSRRKR